MNIYEFIYDVRERIADLLRTFSKRSGIRFVPVSGDHKTASGYLERGRKHYNRKDYERAEQYFKKAVHSDESYALAHYYLGLAQYKLDDSDSAMKSWHRAAEIEPHSNAGSKARAKMQYAKKHMTRTLAELESRIRED